MGNLPPARTRRPCKFTRQLGLLHLLTGNIHATAEQLAKAPGLGWSGDEHPGPLLLAAFAGLLSDRTEAPISKELFAVLHEPPDDFSFGGDTTEDQNPKLVAPSVGGLIVGVRPKKGIDRQGRLAMLEAMQTAATSRGKGILAGKRRRHYGQLATLVACCAELAPSVGKQAAVSKWVDGFQTKYSRFHAFQGEIQRALGSQDGPEYAAAGRETAI